MSALSIPPSQKTNISVGLESIHNYANVLNPITFVGADQYSVVAVYTEMEVEASEVSEEVLESAEVQVQTDFYEEEIEAVCTDNVGGEERAADVRTEDTLEVVDVAKALETLTKTFALRKESLGQDALTEKNNDSSLNDVLGSANATEEEKTPEGCERSDQSEEKIESHYDSMLKDAQPEDMENNKDLCSDSKEETSKDPACETHTSQLVSASVRRSTRLQLKPSKGQERRNIQRGFREISEEAKMYENIYTITLVWHILDKTLS